jgi:hypothetical protein
MATLEGVSAGHHGMMAMDQKVFLSMMVAHHQMALDMAEVVVKAGKDPGVKALAHDQARDRPNACAVRAPVLTFRSIMATIQAMLWPE